MKKQWGRYKTLFVGEEQVAFDSAVLGFGYLLDLSHSDPLVKAMKLLESEGNLPELNGGENVTFYDNGKEVAKVQVLSDDINRNVPSDLDLAQRTGGFWYDIERNEILIVTDYFTSKEALVTVA